CDPGDEIDSKIQQCLCRIDERCLFGQEVQQHPTCDKIEVTFVPFFQVTQDSIEHRKPCDTYKRFVTDIPSVVEHVWRNNKHESGDERSPFAEEIPPGPDHAYGRNAEQHRGDPGSQIRRTENEIDQRQHVELERSMHHWSVLVALSAIQQPRKIRMQAFIMTHDPCFEVVKSREYCKQN